MHLLSIFFFFAGILKSYSIFVVYPFFNIRVQENLFHLYKDTDARVKCRYVTFQFLKWGLIYFVPLNWPRRKREREKKSDSEMKWALRILETNNAFGHIEDREWMNSLFSDAFLDFFFYGAGGGGFSYHDRDKIICVFTLEVVNFEHLSFISYDRLLNSKRIHNLYIWSMKLWDWSAKVVKVLMNLYNNTGVLWHIIKGPCFLSISIFWR